VRLVLLSLLVPSLLTGCMFMGLPQRASTHPPRRSSDVHQVDWANVTLPGSVCGASHAIHLHRHLAVVVSNRWGKRWRSAAWPAWPRVTVDAGWNPVVYGDIDGDGKDEAALVVGCNNGGGTAGGFLAYAQVIFTAGKKSPRVFAILTPQQRPYPNVLPTLLQVTIRRGEVIAHEAWYGANDGTCCPSGRSTTTWRYANGTLRPVKVRACRAVELAPTVGFSAGAGVALGGFWVKNRGSSTCAIGGLPRVKLYRADGRRVATGVLAATSRNSTLPQTKHVSILRPRAEAVAWIQWSSYCGSLSHGLFRFELTLRTGVTIEARTPGGIAKCYPSGRNRPGPGEAGLTIDRFSKPLP
jgi:hypothetical protein